MTHERFSTDMEWSALNRSLGALLSLSLTVSPKGILLEGRDGASRRSRVIGVGIPREIPVNRPERAAQVAKRQIEVVNRADTGAGEVDDPRSERAQRRPMRLVRRDDEDLLFVAQSPGALEVVAIIPRPARADDDVDLAREADDDARADVRLAPRRPIDVPSQPPWVGPQTMYSPSSLALTTPVIGIGA